MILQHTEKELKQVCSEIPLEEITSDHTKEIVVKLKQEAILSKRSALGLAANQIGILKRIFIMEINNKYQAFINPKIITATGKIKTKEGCLSFRKEDKYKIKRKAFVELEFYNGNGEKEVKFFNGIEAVCAQHEIDHLNGITMRDRYREQEL